MGVGAAGATAGLGSSAPDAILLALLLLKLLLLMILLLLLLLKLLLVLLCQQEVWPCWAVEGQDGRVCTGDY